MAAAASGSILAASTEPAPASAQAIAAMPHPAAKSSTRLPATEAGLSKTAPRQRLTAWPGKGPERRIDVAGGEPRFRRLPDRGYFGLRGERNLGQKFRPRHDGIGANESALVGFRLGAAQVRRSAQEAIGVNRPRGPICLVMTPHAWSFVNTSS